ncbi:MAG: aminotransferase class III-fold pyridoxal phosphate-dependent enzyme [Planctomycetota bacterium]
MSTLQETDAVRIAREELDRSVIEARRLPGERDDNFVLLEPGGAKCVLKIAPRDDDPAELELQHAALEHLAEHAPHLAVPKCLAGPVTLQDPLAKGRRARLTGWLEGRPLGMVQPHGKALLASLGRMLGELDVALEGFAHPAQNRVLKWDLACGLAVIAERVGDVEAARREGVENWLTHSRDRLVPFFERARRGVVHNDANDYNVLVGRDGERVSGLIDFGDLLETARISELAIALAYAMLGKPEPLLAGREVVRGYHSASPVEEDEADHLIDLVRLRLLVSVCNSARERRRHPDNEYLAISEAPAWALLDRLRDVPDAWSTAVFREACGYEPIARSSRIREWLRSTAPASVVGEDLPAQPSVWIDLSVGSADLAALSDDRDLEAWSEMIRRRLQETGARIAFGRYDEPRLAYATDAFRQPGFEIDELRTVHIGIDVFVPAGTDVCSPLSGKVHSFQVNEAPRDYGPTILLEHTTDGGDPFWTLYGHLSASSLEGLSVGQVIEAGQRIAHIGDASENGGWPPHLHFQVMTDLLGKSGDFPGVGTASTRDVWRSVCPDPSALLGIGDPLEKASDVAGLEQRRGSVLGPSLSLSYREPLHIVKGRGAWLFDVTGQPFLDTVNNVCHVGHCHRRVVAAGQRQMAVLNTNTRYLHETILRYGEKLLAKLPDPLEVVFFVCSGSEANELALRLAEAKTGARDVIVLEGGYHGNTGRLVELSHYKYSGAGGRGAGEGVHALPMPDPYRGRIREGDPEIAAKYAAFAGEVIDELLALGRRPSAFLGESILSCGGQIDPPEGYLEAVYRTVRGAGGVCIADEVQTGFGRVGTHFWAFERQRVVPDIVTMGKPIGNGHPLAAVATTREIAAAFASGMEYFNTYGGNPVSCAIGEAVLDVIDEEGLQRHALEVGRELEAGLRALQGRFEQIGDVRGAGLFLGFELVEDPSERTPNAALATRIANRMRELGILASTDGPEHDVIKIKPPLVFSREHAMTYCEVLEKILTEQ